MYRITFVVDALRDGRDPLLKQRAETTLLRALTQTDRLFLAANPATPPLMASGVQAEPRTSGDWQDIPTSIATRSASREALACWHAAEAGVRVGGWTDAPVKPAPRPTGRVPFMLGLFKGDHDRDLSHDTLSVLLYALMWIDVQFLLANPDTPPLYKAGVRYEEEPLGREDWQDAPTTMRLGQGDCEDLACWRAAEYRVREGIPAWPSYTSKVRPDGGYLYHIQTSLPDGRVEDPSRALGMR